MYGSLPGGGSQRRPSEAENLQTESPGKLQGSLAAVAEAQSSEAASSGSRRSQKASGGPLLRAASANLVHRGSAAARAHTPPATSCTLEEQQGPRDERFDFLKQQAQATVLESAVGDDEMVLVELPARPGVTTVYRSATARSRSPDRLVLDRHQLSRCPFLESEERLRLLSFQSNSISRIENLEMLPNLVFLDLYDNQVEQIENLESLPSLRVLMLGKNQVSRIQNLESLTRLDVLDLHSNRITQIEEMQHLRELRVLNLAGNLIREVDNMAGFVSLTELNLRRNELASIAGIEVLSHLQRFFASHNQVAAFEGLEPLRALEHLSELALDGNPVCDLQDYQRQVTSLCPGLRLLDQRQLFEDDKDCLAPGGDSSASPATAGATVVAEVEASIEQESVASAGADAAQSRSSNASSAARPSGTRTPFTSGMGTAAGSASALLPRGPGSSTAAARHGVAASAGHRTGSHRASRPSSAGAGRPSAQFEEPSSIASASRSRDRSEHGRAGAAAERDRSGAGSSTSGAQKLLSSHDVLREIRTQWEQAIAAGRTPVIRYGYVRREQPHELAVYGRGLEALDKPEYQSVITSIHFNFITMVSVLQDMPRLLKFSGLKSLSFSQNQLTGLSQLEALQQVPGLTSLCISDNPICETRSALRIQAIRLLPGLRSFNGREVTVAERDSATKVFEPFERLVGIDNIAPARHQRRKDCGPSQIAKLVGDLTAHACTVDDKIREVHVNFEAVMRDAIREAWDDVLALEATIDGSREVGTRIFSPLDLAGFQTRFMAPARRGVPEASVHASDQVQMSTQSSEDLNTASVLP